MRGRDARAKGIQIVEGNALNASCVQLLVHLMRVIFMICCVKAQAKYSFT